MILIWENISSRPEFYFPGYITPVEFFLFLKRICQSGKKFWQVDSVMSTRTESVFGYSPLNLNSSKTVILIS